MKKKNISRELTCKGMLAQRFNTFDKNTTIKKKKNQFHKMHFFFRKQSISKLAKTFQKTLKNIAASGNHKGPGRSSAVETHS